MAKHFAVVGSPISHSLSPAIHRAAYDILKLDWTYDRFEVKSGELQQFIRDHKMDGLSVTMPLKFEAFELADMRDETAIETGVANTLLFEPKLVKAFNTDVFGLQQAISMAQLGPLEKVAVLGSGATAASALSAILRVAPKAKVKIVARNISNATELISRFRKLGQRVSISKSLHRVIAKSDLVVSTLPGGALGALLKDTQLSKKVSPNGALLDIAYSEWPSAAASLWVDSGKQVISGIEMLIWQAVAQIRIFKNGTPEQLLENESKIIAAIRSALASNTN